MKRVAFVFVVLLFTSCIGKRIEKQAEKDREIIEQYVLDNNLDAHATGSGLYYVILEEGNGTRPRSSSVVTVAYKGYFTGGEVFDQSEPDGVTFSLTEVIEGWKEGIPLFKEDAKGVLLIPSKLGYGSHDRPGIPGNSVLIFDIHLVSVDQL